MNPNINSINNKVLTEYNQILNGYTFKNYNNYKSFKELALEYINNNCFPIKTMEHFKFRINEYFKIKFQITNNDTKISINNELSEELYNLIKSRITLIKCKKNHEKNYILNQTKKLCCLLILDERLLELLHEDRFKTSLNIFSERIRQQNDFILSPIENIEGNENNSFYTNRSHNSQNSPILRDFNLTPITSPSSNISTNSDLNYKLNELSKEINELNQQFFKKQTEFDNISSKLQQLKTEYSFYKIQEEVLIVNLNNLKLSKDAKIKELETINQKLQQRNSNTNESNTLFEKEL